MKKKTGKVKKKTVKKKAKTSSVVSRLKKAKERADKNLWKGPEVDGITQSMISSYLNCPERFRIKYIEGLSAPERFSVAMEYGNMWHICEEHIHGDFEGPLKEYAMKLVRRFPHDGDEIDKYYKICRIQFRIYLDRFSSQTEKVIFPEQVFCVPYNVHGYRVKLRGMIDGIMLGTDSDGALRYRLKENKVKGRINEDEIASLLHFDIQTNLYFIAADYYRVREEQGLKKSVPLKGLMYNVIRRPLSGGAPGNIRKKKGSKNVPPETFAEYYARLEEVLREHTDVYFYRWDVEMTEQDSLHYQSTFLRPILQNICQDFEWWTWCKQNGKRPFSGELRKYNFPDHSPNHFRFPFGTYSALKEEKGSVYDEYLRTGSSVGLVRGNRLFPELYNEGESFE